MLSFLLQLSNIFTRTQEGIAMQFPFQSSGNRGSETVSERATRGFRTGVNPLRRLEERTQARGLTPMWRRPEGGEARPGWASS